MIEPKLQCIAHTANTTQMIYVTIHFRNKYSNKDEKQFRILLIDGKFLYWPMLSYDCGNLM